VMVIIRFRSGISRYRPTTWRSADGPALQNHLEHTSFTAKEHTNANAKPKANSAGRRVGQRQ
jgi:hypothetical protein